MVAAANRDQLMRGDFIDSIVESGLQSIVGQLKAEYRKEISKALTVAKKEQIAPWGDTPTGPGSKDSVAVPMEEGHSQQVWLEQPTQPDEAWDPSRLPRLRPTTVAWQKDGPVAPDSSQPPRLNVPEPEDAFAIGGQDAKPVRASRTSSLSPGRITSKPELNADGAHDRSFRAQSTKGLSHGASVNKGLMLTEDDEKFLNAVRDEETKAVAPGSTAGRASMTFASREFSTWPSRRAAYNVITSPVFDFFIGIIIVVNALTIGMESTYVRSNEPLPFYLHALEYSFLAIYTVELGLRCWSVGTRHAFKSNWVRFDAVLVASGVINLIVTVTALQGETAVLVNNVNMLKMTRLLRLARTARVLVQFRTLWLLVQGLFYALMPMFWTTVIMLVVVYIFSVAGMEVVVQNPSKGVEYDMAASQFDSVYSSMVFLMQFITLDSVAPYYRPLIFENPILVFYFLPFFLLGPIALMNIVTAIMVESSLRTANEDQEAKKAWEKSKRKAMMPKLRNIFFALDSNEDSEIDLEELLAAPEEVKDQLKRIVDLDELEEIFHMLDYDGGGSISVDEFVEGIMRSQADKPSELMVIIKQGKAILGHLRDGGGGTVAHAKSTGLAVDSSSITHSSHVEAVPDAAVDATKKQLAIVPAQP